MDEDDYLGVWEEARSRHLRHERLARGQTVTDHDSPGYHVYAVMQERLSAALERAALADKQAQAIAKMNLQEKARAEAAEAENERTLAVAGRLDAEVSRLQEALAFYADPATWESDGGRRSSLASRDVGLRANAALRRGKT